MARPIRKPDDSDIVDAFADGLVTDMTSDGIDVPDQVAQHEARRGALDGAVSTSSRALVRVTDRPLRGSASFFRRAAEELVTSTRTGRELAGSCFVKERGGRTLLVGLKREMSGMPGRVGIDPDWGAVLWHTHPGLRGSLAAFSIEDLEVAKASGKPLLVIGFVGFSLDVLSTLALPFGLKAALASGGIKALLALERSGKIPTQILEYGVGARVCWPSGAIQPVRRRKAVPLQQAFDEMSFTFDRGVGAVERAGQSALREVMRLFVDRPKR
jgi:hypothetical protein